MTQQVSNLDQIQRTTERGQALALAMQYFVQVQDKERCPIKLAREIEAFLLAPSPVACGNVIPFPTKAK